MFTDGRCLMWDIEVNIAGYRFTRRAADRWQRPQRRHDHFTHTKSPLTADSTSFHSDRIGSTG